MREGQVVQVFDNTGWEYEVVLVKAANGEVAGQIREKYYGDTEPKLHLTLFLSLTQRDKFEWALQKCTEVGVTSFVPVITNRSLVRRKDKAAAKYPRWRRIIQEAAEQSRRARLPYLHEPLILGEAFDFVQENAMHSAILWAGGPDCPLQQWVVQRSSHAEQTDQIDLGLFIGPEGGYTGAEIEMAQEAGVQPVSLGKRILRMETAAIVGTAVVLNAFDELS